MSCTYIVSDHDKGQSYSATLKIPMAFVVARNQWQPALNCWHWAEPVTSMASLSLASAMKEVYTGLGCMLLLMNIYRFQLLLPNTGGCSFYYSPLKGGWGKHLLLTVFPKCPNPKHQLLKFYTNIVCLITQLFSTDMLFSYTNPIFLLFTGTVWKRHRGRDSQLRWEDARLFLFVVLVNVCSHIDNLSL